jgi:flagellar basal-body rod protein FlgG
MSVQALYTAATGMQAMEAKLDVIANNLANVNTTGFKKGRANFEDLFYRHYILPGAEDDGGGKTATGNSVGLGTRVSSVQTDFKQGAFQLTNNSLDVAIEGNGFFPVRDGNDTLYTRSGNFSVNADGNLVLGSATKGRLLEPSIQIPQDAREISIQPDGRVMVTQPGTTTAQEVGRLQLATFINPEGLLKRGENLFQETDASGPVTTANPGDTGLGNLQQNALETSNV